MNNKTILIFLDFEATCDENVKNYPNEIIEFPMIATIINNENIEVNEDIFHQYVKPIINSTLTTFCKNLTGITQEKVDSSSTLNIVIKDATRWIHELFEKYDTTKIIFCTWGDWDLSTCLPNDAIYKKIKLPSVFKTPNIINLRKVFIKYLNYRPSGLEDALKYLGMKFVGTPHSGIDDTRNTMLLAKNIFENYGTLDI